MNTEYAWHPSEDFLRHSHIAKFIRRHDIADYAALQRRSAADTAWFWEAAAQDGNIQWMRPYEQVLDQSEGAPWAKWFKGGLLNLVDNVLDRHTVGASGERLAYIWEGEDGHVRRLPYNELYLEVNRAANALQALGVTQGDRVAIYMPVLPETIIAALATLKLGAIVVPLFSGFSGSALTARLIDSGAKVVISADGFYRRGKAVSIKPKLDEALVDVPNVKSVVLVARTGENVRMDPARDVWWQQIVPQQSAKAQTVAMDPNSPAILGYTSGTTGTPKGAVLTHIGLLLMGIKEVRLQFDYRDGETFLWVTDWGWAVLPLWVMAGVGCAGGTSVIFEGAIDYPESDRLWRMVADYKVNIFGLAATAARILSTRGDHHVRKHDLSSLRVLGSTGESWNEVPWRWFFEIVGGGRCPIINGSGGTEVTGCFVAPSVLEPIKPCSVGGPVPGIDAVVVDGEGAAIERGLGYLVCRKPWPGMTQGVWGNPARYIEAYWSTFPDVWFHGDWVEIDEDGSWFVLGRADDTMKVSGRRIGPAEIESVLVSQPVVAEAAAIGVPDPLRGESIVCFVVLRPEHVATEELLSALQDAVAANMGSVLRPTALYAVKDLPRTRSAKIVRRAIRLRYLGEKLPADLSMIENPESLEGIQRRPAGREA